MRSIFYSLLFLFSLLSCQNSSSEQQGQQSVSEKQASPAALRVAVAPTLSALPLYYALATQAAEKGVKGIVVLPIHAGIDGEELLQKGKADIILSDEVRTIYQRSKGMKWKIIANTTEEAGIVTSQQLRLHKLPQLEERTLAVPRFCALDLLREQAQVAAKLPYDKVLPAQINDLYLRTRMLDESQVEAAVLPEPFLSMAKEKGHIDITPKEHQRFSAAWIASEKALSEKQKEMVRLVAIYNAAVQQLHQKKDSTVLASIAERLRLTEAGLKKIETYRYAPMTRPQEKDLQAEVDYLNRRAGHKKYHTAQLITHQLFP